MLYLSTSPTKRTEWWQHSETNGLTETTVRVVTIFLMVLTTLLFGVRALIRVENKPRVRWHDAWLFSAYIFFMATAAFYLVRLSAMFRIAAVREGKTQVYPGLAKDGYDVQTMFFYSGPGLWFTLWSVKFSLLAFYKKLMINISLYIRLWWIVVVFCVLALIATLVLNVFVCVNPKDWFTVGACAKPEDVRMSAVGLWEAFAADIVSDLLIMLLPIGLMRRLQMGRAQKLSVMALFSLGGVCMLASILRVTKIGKISDLQNDRPSIAWLALWSTIETAVAVIVGCGPGFYRKIRSINKSRQTADDSDNSYTKNSRGRVLRNTESRLYPLHPMPSNNIGPGDKTDSQENLVGIRVSKKFSVLGKPSEI